MPSSASSSSSLYIIGASSPRGTAGADLVDIGSDTDDDDVTSSGADALLSRPTAERFVSSFRTQESLAALCKKHGVPEQFTPLPGGDLRACSAPPPGAACVYAHALEAGLRVPLHPFFAEALTHFGLAPSQIAPNGWRAMAGFAVLCHFAGVPAYLAVFRHFFTLCALKLKGWYCFRGKDAAGALFTGLPKSRKGWKEAFFFLRSPAPWPCPVKWGEPAKSATAEPVLTKEQKSVAAKLLRAHGTAVDLRTYLCESNIAAAMITGGPPPVPPRSPPRTPAAVKGKFEHFLSVTVSRMHPHL